MTPQTWVICSTSPASIRDSLIEHLICSLAVLMARGQFALWTRLAPVVLQRNIVSTNSGLGKWSKGHRITEQGRALQRGSSSIHSYVDQTALSVQQLCQLFHMYH
jgi:hypothetical protein